MHGKKPVYVEQAQAPDIRAANRGTETTARAAFDLDQVEVK